MTAGPEPDLDWPAWARADDPDDTLNDAAIRHIGTTLAADPETRRLAADLTAAAEAYWHLRRTAATSGESDLAAAIEAARHGAETLSVGLARLDPEVRRRLVSVIGQAPAPEAKTAEPAVIDDPAAAHRRLERLTSRLETFAAAARRTRDALAPIAAHQAAETGRLDAAIAELRTFYRDFLAEAGAPPPDDAALAAAIRRALRDRG